MNKNGIEKHFGKAIRNWRTRRGLSQQELARRANLQRTYISDVERGARNTSLRSIKKLADALKVSLQMLFQFEKIQNK
jgi:transcriptional regulator with XRE-family HTH domain